jgi:hypothetical protein
MNDSARLKRGRFATGVVTAALATAVAATPFGLGACAHAPLPPAAGLAWQSPPAVAATTLAMWRFDETTGLEFADAGPARRDGVLGIDTRTAFGRFRNARLFTPSINSFALVPAPRAPRLDETWTIEAWINPSQYGPVECSVIAARWTDQPNEQGWMLGITGFDRSAIQGAPPRPDVFESLIARRGIGLLLFALQPRDAGTPQGFASTLPIDLNRWTHVAVTDDGSELRMYLDGRLDAQFATTARVRDTDTPLVIGNQIDARWLTESQGPLRVPDDANRYPFYAYEGLIDELRISGTALTNGRE